MSGALGLPFFQRALAGGVIVGLITSLLGVFVVLRRSSFFGDAIAHASLAGVAVGVVTGIPPLFAAGTVAVGIGLALNRFERKSRLSIDTILGFFLAFFMALGVLILSLRPGYQPELLSYLFGSILSVSPGNLVAVGGIGLLVGLAVAILRRSLTFATFDSDGARVSGIPVDRVLTVYNALLALVVIASVKVVGVILVNALLVLPAATAKRFSRSVGEMFLLAPLLGVSSVVAGLFLSLRWNAPSGPAIALVSGAVFLASALVRRPPMKRVRPGRARD
jgi:zinc transport system permease protein